MNMILLYVSPNLGKIQALSEQQSGSSNEAHAILVMGVIMFITAMVCWGLAVFQKVDK